MILRSLEVEGFRCFDRQVSLNEFAPGLNVIAGPNGAGKSTLLRALRHLLVDAHSLTGAAVRQAMAPWGRALNPRIRAVIAHGGTEWRLEKRFLSAAFARLERLENGGFRPVAEGKEAESRIREMLLADAPAKGPAVETHLGLLQILWTPQGPPSLPDWSPRVRTTLQEAFGAALSSNAADRITALADERFGEYFSPTGQVKKASPVTALQQEVARERETWQDLDAQWHSAGKHRETLVVLRQQIDERAKKHAALSELAAAKGEEARARHQYLLLDTQVQQWRGAMAEKQRLDGQSAESAALHAESTRRLAEAEAARPKIAALEQQLDALRVTGEDARAWPDLTRKRELERESATLQQELTALREPAADEMQETNRLHQLVQVKRAALDAASLKLTLEAEAPLSVTINGQPHTVAAGEVLPATDPSQIVLHMQGIARITAANANPQAAGLAGEVDRLTAALNQRLHGETIEALEQRFRQAQELRRQLDAKSAELRPLAARTADLEAVAQRHPEWESQAPDIEAIRTEWRNCQEALKTAKAEHDYPALAAAEASARTRLENIGAQLTQIGARLDQFAATGNLEALESRRAEAAVTLSVALTRLEKLPVWDAALSTIENELRALTDTLNTSRETAARLEGELKALQSRDLYAKLAEAEERLAERTAELDRHQQRASAVRLLKETLAASRQTLTASLPLQIAEQATRIWRRIAGDAAPAIRIGDAWRPSGLVVEGAEPAIDELSGGEAEQVAFATRLALATQITANGPHLAVFDDAFLATDPARAGQILALLAEASQSMQIVILTCHPSRYENIPGARRFDLASLKE